MFEYKDPRFRYDLDGNYLGPNSNYQLDEQRQRQAQPAAAGSLQGDTPFAGFLFSLAIAIAGVWWLSKRLPLWQLCIAAAAVPAGATWYLGRILRFDFVWSKPSVKIAQALFFGLFGALFYAMLLDLNGWGSLLFRTYLVIAAGLLVIGASIAVVQWIFRHPIRTVVIGTISGWLIWVIFIQKPERTTTTAMPPQPRSNSVRNGTGRRSTNSTRQSQSPQESAPRPEPSRDDAGPARPGAAAPIDDLKHAVPERSEPAAKNQDHL